MKEFAQKIGRLFLVPAALIILLVVVGFGPVVVAVVFSEYPRLSEVLKLAGVTVLGSGVFTAATKAIVYGGIFKDTVKEALLELKTPSGIEAFDRRFVVAVDRLVGKRDYIDTIDILAHSSSKYLSVLKDHKVSKIKRVRLLLASEQAVQTAITPASPTDRIHAWHEIELTISKWRAAAAAHEFETVEVRTLPFVPMFHLMIVDKAIGMVGVFRPIASGSGVNALGSFALRQDDPVGGKLLTDLQTIFDDYFKNHAQPYPGVPVPAPAPVSPEVAGHA